MFQSKIVLWLFNLQLLFCSCHKESSQSDFSKGRHFYKVTTIGKLASEVNECSGLIKSSKDTTFWTHNDSGGKPEIYEVDIRGKLLSTINFTNLENEDWEEITRDNNGNLYVGDIGNNDNKRRSLMIYKVKESEPSKVEKISFHYADQERFPPAKEDKNFDCEAFFAHGDSLYLFSKNRGNNLVKMYAVPSKAGNYALLPKGQVLINAMVTGAAISPDEKTFALLTYGKVVFFGIKNHQIDFKHPKKCYTFAFQQSEAITFLTNNTLLISNEQGELAKIQIEKK